MSEVRCRHDVRLIFCPVCQPSPPAPQPDPNDLASLVRPIEADRDRLQTRIAELERQADELHARCLEAERQGMSTTLPAGLVDRLEKRIAELEEERDAARAELARSQTLHKAALDEMVSLDNERLRQLNAARAECESRTRKANAVLEETERSLYLEMQRLEAEAAQMREALEKIEDPRKRGHKEPDAYTQLGCVMNIASEALASTTAGTEAFQRLEAEAARIRSAASRLCDMADYPYGKCDRWTRALGEALASTTAGTLALGVIEAARGIEAEWGKYIRGWNPASSLLRELGEALHAYDQATSNSRSRTAGNEPTSGATPHLKNTDISRDSDCQCMLIGNQTEPDINLDCPVHGKQKDGGETPGGSDGK